MTDRPVDRDPERPARQQAKRLADAQAQVVPGFPEIRKRNARCRICKLIDTHPELVHAIHELIRQGVGPSALERRFASVLEEAHVPHIYRASYERHVAEHITKMGLVVKLTDERERRLATPEVIPAREVTDEELDYVEMRRLFTQLSETLAQVSRAVAGKEELTSYDLNMLIALYRELRNQIETLNKMRNSDRLTKAILEAHTRQLLQLLSEPLSEALRDVYRMLLNGDYDGAAARMGTLLSADLAPMFVSSGREAMQMSIEHYKLH